ncbi:hypothetical protein AB4Y44_13995 [Paraburkholderia sp. BR10937]
MVIDVALPAYYLYANPLDFWHHDGDADENASRNTGTGAPRGRGG